MAPDVGQDPRGHGVEQTSSIRGPREPWASWRRLGGMGHMWEAHGQDSAGGAGRCSCLEGPWLQLDQKRTELQVMCSTSTSGKHFSGEGARTTGPNPGALDTVRDACHVCDELREAGLEAATSWGHRPDPAGISRVAETVGKPTEQRVLEARACRRAPFSLDVLGWSLGLWVGCAQAPLGSHQLVFCFHLIRWRDRLEAGGLRSLHFPLSQGLVSTRYVAVCYAGLSARAWVPCLELPSPGLYGGTAQGGVFTWSRSHRPAARFLSCA